MKKIVLLILVIGHTLYGQKQDISLKDIWIQKTFATESLVAFHSMINGDFYSILEQNNGGTELNKYSYKSLQKIQTIVNSEDLDDISYFDNFTFNNAETKLIIGIEREKIYRRSWLGKYYVFDLNTQKLDLIIDKNIREPTFSPDGTKIAYVSDNNLFIKNLFNGKITQITFDGKINEIINGVSDWVYEEEFSIVKTYQWNFESNKIAFLRFDETNVPEFSMDIYGNGIYPQRQVFKYPKAGEANSDVSLHMYHLDSNKTSTITLGDYGQYYIPRIQWTPQGNNLSVITLNRHQNNLNIVLVNGNTLKHRLLLNEKDSAYLSVKNIYTYLNDNSFIWTSEKDGFNHIYHYDKDGNLINQITSGPWEITSFYGLNPKSKRIFYQSTEDGSINRGIYSIDLKGKNKKRLSKTIGTNSAAFSKSFNYYINTFSNSTTPPIYTLVNAKTGKEIKEIKNNVELSKKLTGYNMSKKEFSLLKTKNGDFNMWMLKPRDFNPEKEYPLLMFQYSGPGSQRVKNSWNDDRDYWHQFMAQRGYIVVCVDGRGTGFRGRDFKKITYKNLGKYELEDQMESAKELGKQSYIDKKRIGIWGWSFGGYISSLAITKGADIFKAAIAVAPVISYRFYDSVYTERYMQTPQENEVGYEENSPLNFADQLKGNYLLVHGTGDDNVHSQNSMRMISALVDANKQFDLFLYPDKAHGILKGNNTRLHLYTKLTTFIDKSIGKSEENEFQNKN